MNPTPYRPLELAWVFLLYFLGAKLGVTLAVMPEGISALWPPNGVILAALIRFGARALPMIAVLVLAAEVAADWSAFTLVEALIFGAANLLEATLAYLLLRRWGFVSSLPTPRDLAVFVLAGPMAGALAAAFVGAAVYSGFRGDQTSYLEFARIWWFGDGVGLLIVTPLLLGFPPFGAADRRFAPGRLDLAVLAGGAAVLALFLASARGMFFEQALGPMVLLPFLLYASARLPPRWAAAVVAVTALAVIGAMKVGLAPFGALAPRDAVIAAQEFVLVASLMTLGLATLLTQLRAQRETLEERVADRTAELVRLNEQLAALAAVDPLTGVYNRRGFLAQAERALAQARRSGRALAVLAVDLDHFKSVNDRYGHAAGDEALRQVAGVLRKAGRGADISARYGGEEFIVMAPETDLAGARAAAERIRAGIAGQPIRAGAEEFRLTASVGITVLDARDSTIDALIERADAALYLAKSGGRDRVEAVTAA